MEKTNTTTVAVNPTLIETLDRFFNGPFQSRFKGKTKTNPLYARGFAVLRALKKYHAGQPHTLNDVWIMKILAQFGYTFQVETTIKVEEPVQ